MFLISLGVVIILLFSGIFLGVGIRNTSLVHEIILERGRSLFQQIVLTRRWAAQYGGVYVRKDLGVESNPWPESVRGPVQGLNQWQKSISAQAILAQLVA